jgi:hypothetical protein
VSPSNRSQPRSSWTWPVALLVVAASVLWLAYLLLPTDEFGFPTGALAITARLCVLVLLSVGAWIGPEERSATHRSLAIPLTAVVGVAALFVLEAICWVVAVALL